MAYNHGKAERRWRLWKEKEEKILRECGVDEETIEEIRTFDREEFNSDRRFYTRLNDVGEYIAETAMQEPPMEVNTVWDIDVYKRQQIPCSISRLTSHALWWTVLSPRG